MPVVPKKRHTRGRRDRRRSQTFKIKARQLVECSRCHEPRLPHRACPSCGFYKDRIVVETE